jgi:hypothetical protein
MYKVERKIRNAVKRFIIDHYVICLLVYAALLMAVDAYTLIDMKCCIA